jgi:multicomponent Na+:H+ antiporter subunit B
MNSIILQIASKYLRFLFLFFAVIALLRGHNYPGGGFIGGLLASLAIVFKSLAYETQKVKDKLKIQPEHYIALGLFLVLLSVLPGLFSGNAIMEGEWVTIYLPLNLNIKLGTPLLFDTGIFFGVIGVTSLFFFTLSTKE